MSAIKEFHALAEHPNTSIAATVSSYLKGEINAAECGDELFRLSDRYGVKSAEKAYDALVGYTALQQKSREDLNKALSAAGVTSSPLKAWDDK